MKKKSAPVIKYTKTVWLSQQKSCNTMLTIPLSLFSERKEVFTMVFVPSMEISSGSFSEMFYYRRIGPDPNELTEQRIAKARVIYSLETLDKFPVVNVANAGIEYAISYTPSSDKPPVEYGKFSLKSDVLAFPAELDDLLVVVHNFARPSESNIGSYLLFSTPESDKTTFSFESDAFTPLALFNVNVVGCTRTLLVNGGAPFSVPIPPILHQEENAKFLIRMIHQMQPSGEQTKLAFSKLIKDLYNCYGNTDWADILGDDSGVIPLLLKGNLLNNLSYEQFEKLSIQQSSIARRELGIEQSLRITLWMTSSVAPEKLKDLNDWDGLWNAICPARILFRDVPITDTEIEKIADLEEKKLLENVRFKAIKMRNFFEWLVRAFERIKLYYISISPVTTDSGETYSQYEYVGTHKGYDSQLVDSVFFTGNISRKQGIYLVQYTRSDGNRELTYDDWVDFYFLEVIPVSGDESRDDDNHDTKLLTFVGNIPKLEPPILETTLKLRNFYPKLKVDLGFAGYKFDKLVPLSYTRKSTPSLLFRGSSHDIFLDVKGTIEQEHRVGIDGALDIKPKAWFKSNMGAPWEDVKPLSSRMTGNPVRDDHLNFCAVIKPQLERQCGISAMALSYLKYFESVFGDITLSSDDSGDVIGLPAVIKAARDHSNLNTDNVGTVEIKNCVFETCSEGLEILGYLSEIKLEEFEGPVAIHSVLKNAEKSSTIARILSQYVDGIIMGSSWDETSRTHTDGVNCLRKLVSVSCDVHPIAGVDETDVLNVNLFYRFDRVTVCEYAVVSITSMNSGENYVCQISGQIVGEIVRGASFVFEIDQVLYLGSARDQSAEICLREIALSDHTGVVAFIRNFARRVNHANRELEGRLRAEFLESSEKSIKTLGTLSRFDSQLLDGIITTQMKATLPRILSRQLSVSNTKPVSGIYLVLGDSYVKNCDFDSLNVEMFISSVFSDLSRDLLAAYSLYNDCCQLKESEQDETLCEILSTIPWLAPVDTEGMCEFLGVEICAELECVNHSCNCEDFAESVKYATQSTRAGLLEGMIDTLLTSIHQKKTPHVILDMLWTVLGEAMSSHGNGCLTWISLGDALPSSQPYIHSAIFTKILKDIHQEFSNVIFKSSAYQLWAENSQSSFLGTSGHLDKILKISTPILDVVASLQQEFVSRLELYSLIYSLRTITRLSASKWVVNLGDVLRFGKHLSNRINKYFAASGLIFKDVFSVVGPQAVGLRVSKNLGIYDPEYGHIKEHEMKYVSSGKKMRQIKVICLNIDYRDSPTQEEKNLLIGADEAETSRKLIQTSDVVKNMVFHLLTNSQGKDSKYTFFNGVLLALLLSTKGKFYRSQIEEKITQLEKILAERLPNSNVILRELESVRKDSKVQSEGISVYEISIDKYLSVLRFLNTVYRSGTSRLERDDLETLKSRDVNGRPSLELEKYLGLVDNSRELEPRRQLLQNTQFWTVVLDNLLITAKLPTEPEKNPGSQPIDKNLSLNQTRIVEKLGGFTLLWEQPSRVATEFHNFIQIPVYLREGLNNSALLSQIIFGGQSNLCDSRFGAYSAYGFQVTMDNPVENLWFYKIDLGDDEHEPDSKSTPWVRLKQSQIEGLEQLSELKSGWNILRKAVVPVERLDGIQDVELLKIITLSGAAVSALLEELTRTPGTVAISGWYNNNLVSFEEKLAVSVEMRGVGLSNLPDMSATIDSILFGSDERNIDEEFMDCFALFSGEQSKSVSGLSGALAAMRQNIHRLWYLAGSGHLLSDAFSNLQERYSEILSSVKTYLDLFKATAPDEKGRRTGFIIEPGFVSSIGDLLTLPDSGDVSVDKEIDAQIFMGVMFGIISDTNKLETMINTSVDTTKEAPFKKESEKFTVAIANNFGQLDTSAEAMVFGTGDTEPTREELKSMREGYNELLTIEEFVTVNKRRELLKGDETFKGVVAAMSTVQTKTNDSRVLTSKFISGISSAVPKNLAVIYDVLSDTDSTTGDHLVSNHSKLFWVVNRKTPAMMYQLFCGKLIECVLSPELESLGVPVRDHVFDISASGASKLLTFVDTIAVTTTDNLVVTLELLERSGTSFEGLLQAVTSALSGGDSSILSELHILGYWNVTEFDTTHTKSDKLNIVEMKPGSGEIEALHRVSIVGVPSVSESHSKREVRNSQRLPLRKSKSDLHQKCMEMFGKLGNLESGSDLINEDVTAIQNGIYYILLSKNIIAGDFNDKVEYLCDEYPNVVERSLNILDSYSGHVAKSPFSSIPLFTEDLITHMVMNLWYGCNSRSGRFLYHRVSLVLMRECKDLFDVLLLNSDLAADIKQISDRDNCARFFEKMFTRHNVSVPALVGWDVSKSFRFSPRKNYPINLFLGRNDKQINNKRWCNLVENLKTKGYDEYSLDLLMRVLSGRMGGLCYLQELIIKDHSEYYGIIDKIYDEELLYNASIWISIISDIISSILVPIVLNLRSLDESEYLQYTNALISSRIKLDLFRFLIGHVRSNNIKRGVQSSHVPDGKQMNEYLSLIDYPNLCNKFRASILYNLEPIDGCAHTFRQMVLSRDPMFISEHPQCTNYSGFSPFYLYSLAASMDRDRGNSVTPLSGETAVSTEIILPVDDHLPKLQIIEDGEKSSSQYLDIISKTLGGGSDATASRLLEKRKTIHSQTLSKGKSPENDFAKVSKNLEKIYTRSVMAGLSHVPVICELASGSCQSDTFDPAVKAEKQAICELARIWLYILRLYGPQLVGIEEHIVIADDQNLEVPSSVNLYDSAILESTGLRKPIVTMYAVEVLFRDKLSENGLTREQSDKWESHISDILKSFVTFSESDIGQIQSSVIKTLGFVRDSSEQLVNKFGALLSVLGYQKLLRMLYNTLDAQYKITVSGGLSQAGVPADSMEKFISDHIWILDLFDLKNCMENPGSDNDIDISWYLFTRYSHKKLAILLFSDPVPWLDVDSSVPRLLFGATETIMISDPGLLFDNTYVGILGTELESKEETLGLTEIPNVKYRKFLQKLWDFVDLCLDTNGVGWAVFFKYENSQLLDVTLYGVPLYELLVYGNKGASENIVNEAISELKVFVDEMSRLRAILEPLRWVARLVRIFALGEDNEAKSHVIWNYLELWKKLSNAESISSDIINDVSSPLVTPSILSNVADIGYYQLDFKHKIRSGLQFLLPLFSGLNMDIESLKLPQIDFGVWRTLLVLENEVFIKKTVNNLVVPPRREDIEDFFSELANRATGQKYDVYKILSHQCEIYSGALSEFSTDSVTDIDKLHSRFMSDLRFMNQFVRLANFVTKIYQYVFDVSRIRGLLLSGLWARTIDDRKFSSLAAGIFVTREYSQSDLYALMTKYFEENQFDIKSEFYNFFILLEKFDILDVHHSCQMYVDLFSSTSGADEIMTFRLGDTVQGDFKLMLQLIRAFALALAEI